MGLGLFHMRAHFMSSLLGFFLKLRWAGPCVLYLCLFNNFILFRKNKIKMLLIYRKLKIYKHHLSWTINIWLGLLGGWVIYIYCACHQGCWLARLLMSYQFFVQFHTCCLACLPIIFNQFLEVMTLIRIDRRLIANYMHKNR